MFFLRAALLALQEPTAPGGAGTDAGAQARANRTKQEHLPTSQGPGKKNVAQLL